MPFRCNYCDGSFCHIHRIPINHSCPFVDSYTEKGRVAHDKDTGSYANVRTSLQNAIKIKSSKTEIIHLSIATILVTAVGMSLNGYKHLSWQFIAVFISAFLVHELAHKFLAQYYGTWAEFRAQMYGLIITAISALPMMPFKFIAPGAVMVGLSDRKQFGRVALIGPMTNIVMGFSFLACAYLLPYHPVLIFWSFLQCMDCHVQFTPIWCIGRRKNFYLEQDSLGNFYGGVDGTVYHNLYMISK